jgi:hypothetical protein
MFSFFLSAVNHDDDQVDGNESDNMLIKQINFFDNHLIVIVIALPCGVVLIIFCLLLLLTGAKPMSYNMSMEGKEKEEKRQRI